MNAQSDFGSDEKTSEFAETGLVLRQIACPLCGSSSEKPLFPSIKFNLGKGCFQPSSDIRVVVCQSCGLIHENPQIVVEHSEGYREKHYYNAYNQIAVHDEQQRQVNPYRWSVLESRLDWPRFRRALDIGASGAWSSWVKEKSPEIESIVVEPSAEAIRFCQENYKNVTAIHGVFEIFSAPEGSIDAISFFSSLYVIRNPLEILKKCKSLLSSDGRLVIVISHLLCEVEVWSEARQRPWLDLDHVIRGVPLVYYSRRTLAALLETAGFEVVEAFETPYPDGTALAGRHDHWVIARPLANGNAAPATPGTDVAEAAWAERFLRGYCQQASHRSVAAFFRNAGAHTRQITVLFDDPAYRDWVLGLLQPWGRSLAALPLDDHRSVDAAVNNAANGTAILNATMTALGHGRVIDCVRPWDGNGYGYFVRDVSGDLIPARAFLPDRKPGSGLFPFAAFHPD